MVKRGLVYAFVISSAMTLILLIISGTLDRLFFSRTEIYYGEIGNPNNPDEKLFIEVKLRSTTFSANTPMQAEVFLFLNGNDRNWKDYDNNTSETYNVLFEDTICSGGEFGQIPSRCAVKLPRHATQPIMYYNTTTLTYSHGGEFDVRLDGLGTQTQQRVGHGFINIASTEALHEFQTFKMSFIIGIIAASFAALSLYERGRSPDESQSSSWFVWKR